MLPRFVLTVTLCSGLAGCDFTGACTTSVEPGLIVHVVDGVTGAPAAHGASAWAIEDEYQEELRNPAPEDPTAERLYGADEREGTYTVSVGKPGYQLWMREGVRVRGDGCHVRTVDLETRLVPEP